MQTTDDIRPETRQSARGVIAGWRNKMQVALSRVMSAPRLAEQHRRIAEPGSGEVHQQQQHTRPFV